MLKVKVSSIEKSLTNQIKQLLLNAKKDVVQTVNIAMVYTYYEIGKIIVEKVQKGEGRAKYGKNVLKAVSHNLISEFGKGFSVDNLERMRQFYSVYSKSSTLSRKFVLSWSHYVFLIRLNKSERLFYERETEINSWSLRELLISYFFIKR